MFGRLLSRSSNNGLGSYEEIPDHHHHHHHGRRGDSAAADNNNGDFPPRTSSSSLMKSVMLGMVALLVGIIVVQGVYVREESEELMVAEAVNRTPEDDESGVVAGAEAAGAPRAPPPPPHVVAEQRSFPVPMPFGVNLGSWLSLEDYFFAGPENSKEVATPDDEAVAACLPPLHLGSRSGRNWQSETDLFAQLIRESGAAHAVRVFAAHRASFIDLEWDLERIASVGVNHVRIPISWCLTDVDPTGVDLSSYGSDDDAILKDFACVDPFYAGSDDDDDDDSEPVLWPAVPRPLIESVLRACANAGLKASLDVHTLPGGTSPGTFSGVWPKRPRFWNHGGDGVLVDGDPSVHPGAVGFGIGHDLLRSLVSWMEDLADRDPRAFAGLKGISPMNEPAHLAAFSHGNKTFLPPLPESLEGDYERSMAIGADTDPDANPSGPALRVFRWFDTALEIFRGSDLPGKGVDFQANIIETIITNTSLGPATQLELIGRWWCAGGNQTTTPEERSTWATLDVHHYLAWSGDFCSGTVDGQNASYACSDAEGRARTLDQKCRGFSPLFRKAIDNRCGPGAKLMSGEFSPASHHTVRRSCTDLASLRDSYLMQVDTASDNDVELYDWSYKMPYGGAFRDGGWSFTQLMYRFGIFDRPDEPSFPCGTSSSSLPEFGGGEGWSATPLDLP